MGYVDEWERWHANRVTALTAPFGPLSSLCRRSDDLLSAGPRWTGPLDNVVSLHRPLDAAEGEVRYVHLGSPLQPEHSPVELTDQQRLLFDHEGAYSLDEIEARSIGITHGMLRVFEPRLEWVVPGVFEPGSAHREHRVVRRTDGSEIAIEFAGTVAFELGGRPTRLVVSPQSRGELHAIFADHSRQRGFPFRFLRLGAPDTAGRVELDFNRAILPLAVFDPSWEHWPAPTPVPGNLVDLEIRAGEHDVVRDPTADSISSTG